MGTAFLVQKNFQAFVTNGLVLHLDAGNSASYPGTGSTWFDLSGNGFNGSLVNTGFSTSNGGVITFNGNAHANFGNSLTLTPPQTSFSIFVKFSTFSNRPHFGKGDGGTGWIYLVGETSSSLNTYFTVGNTGSWTAASGGSLSTNVWYHWTFTYDGSVGRNYINGNLTGSLNNSGSLRTNYTANPFYLGRILNTNNFTGELGNFQLYNRALSQIEIQQNFNTFKGRFGL